jgi:hypothetical protein
MSAVLKELRAEIQVNASSMRVWNILADFEKYEEWNPFIQKIAGEPKEGSRIKIHLRTPGGKNRQYEPIVTKVDQGRELRWIGKSMLLTGEHIFMIEGKQAESVLFIQRELFGGFLASFFGRSTHEDIEAGFRKMNEALKQRAEQTQV